MTGFRHRPAHTADPVRVANAPNAAALGAPTANISNHNTTKGENNDQPRSPGKGKHNEAASGDDPRADRGGVRQGSGRHCGDGERPDKTHQELTTVSDGQRPDTTTPPSGVGARRPRLLDLFCGAGGAAVGYHRAGFDIVGVDIKPQPNYPFEFRQADALAYVDWNASGFDAVHASPPCQAYTVANNVWQREHPDLLPATRDLLEASGLPWVIENVPGAPMHIGPPTLFEPHRNGVVVCGLALGLNVKRHRLFESNCPLVGTVCPHGHPGDWLLVFGHTVLQRGHVIRKTPAGHNTTRRRHTTVERGRAAMGIDWMNRDELSQAIPPAYTEHIGTQLLEHIRAAA